jgi:hypothetical protein
MHLWSIIAFILALAAMCTALACAYFSEKLQRATYIIFALLAAGFAAVLVPAVFKLKS